MALPREGFDLEAFCDASFSRQEQIAIAGFAMHYARETRWWAITCDSPSAAELHALSACCDFIRREHPTSRARVHCDSQDAIRAFQGDPQYPNITVVYHRGHCKKTDRPDDVFHRVDQKVRRELRLVCRARRPKRKAVEAAAD